MVTCLLFLGVVDALVEHGASAFVFDRWGCTPMDVASEHNHQELLAWLRLHASESIDSRVSRISTMIARNTERIEMKSGSEIEPSAKERSLEKGAVGNLMQFDMLPVMHRTVYMEE